MIEIKPIYGVAVKYENEEQAVLLRHTITHKREYVLTRFDETKFSEPPESCVFLVEINTMKVLDSNQGSNTGEWK